MNDLVSITELAALREITTETLRHYDRIGLYKPDYVDPGTGYRYYSISYHNEKIGTIKELKQMGLSLSEIDEKQEIILSEDCIGCGMCGAATREEQKKQRILCASICRRRQTQGRRDM